MMPITCRRRCMRATAALFAWPRVQPAHRYHRLVCSKEHVMSLPCFTRAAAATTPALCLTRRAYSTAFSRSPGCLASKHKTSSPTDYDRDEDEEEEDEMRRVQIFRPPMSAEEQKRRRATSHFLAQLLTTADEQEWRDMLAAALRCGTWKEHHTLALLRGVHASRYDTMPAAAEEEEVNDEEDNRRDEKNEVKKEETAAAAARQGTGRAHTSHTPVTTSSTSSTRAAMPSQRRSTATQRLRRVRDVVQFCLDEGIRAEESSNSSSNTEHEGSMRSNTDDGGGCVVYRPQDSTVHSLLVHTLRAACYPVGTSSHPSQSASSSTTTGSSTNNNTPLQPSQEHTAHEAETTTPQHDHAAAAAAVGEQRQLHEDENNTQGEQGVVGESEAGRQSNKTGMADRSHTQRAMPHEEDAEHPCTTTSTTSISSSGSTAHEHTTSDTIGSASQPASAMALACYGEVWSLLAWMERHGYHPQSFRVLDELERLVDTEDEAGALQQQQQGIGRADGALGAAGNVGGRHQRRPGTRRVAMAMSHIHRTEYLRRERDWLKEELERRARAEAEGQAHRASTGSGAIASSHKTAARPGSAPRPRPEPQTR